MVLQYMLCVHDLTYLNISVKRKTTDKPEERVTGKTDAYYYYTAGAR